MLQLRKKILILTEGGKESGLGHITRCVSICNEFHLKGISPIFLVHGDDSVKSSLKGFEYHLVNWIEDFYETKVLIQSSLIVLIDSMQISRAEIINISDLNTHTIHIDDEKQYNIINNGFILDWTINRADGFSLGNRKTGVTYLVGSEFTPLRPEFYNSPQYVVKKTMKSMLITFGGSDVRNITPNVLKLLIDKFPNIEKKVVIGSGCKSIESIYKIADENTRITFDAAASDMVQNMHESDLAIASGGQTLYELAMIGTPTISITLVRNAIDDNIGWNKVGFLKNIGWYSDKNLIENLDKEINKLQDYEQRKKMSKIGQFFMTGNGAKLIVKRVLKEINGPI